MQHVTATIATREEEIKEEEEEEEEEVLDDCVLTKCRHRSTFHCRSRLMERRRLLLQSTPIVNNN